MGGYATNPDTNASSEITGSGTANYMAKFTAAQVIGNSSVTDNGTTVATTSLVNIGNASDAGGSLSQLRVGKGTAYIDLGEASAGVGAIWFTTATPTSSNYSLYGDGASVVLNAPNISGAVSLGIGNAVNTYQSTRYTTVLTNQAATSGAITTFTFTKPNNTGQTASTAINGFLFTTGSRQWATGAITTQREFYITSPTYSFVGASTITAAYTLYVDPPVAGTNATLTAYALGLGGNLRFPSGNATISGSNAITLLSSSGSNLVLNAGSTGGSGVNFQGQGTARFSLVTATDTSGAVSYVTYSPSSNTGQTASTEVNGFLYNSYTRTWAAGAITTQREQYIKTVTYAFASASTITNAYGLYVEAPTAGTNATITNNWAIAAYGSLAILNNGILKLGNAATTGLVAGALAATTNASIVLYDSTGQAYRVPCII